MRGDCEWVAFLRANLDGLPTEFHSIQPLFALDKVEIDISTHKGPILTFSDLFKHAHIGDEVRIDFSEGPTKSQ